MVPEIVTLNNQYNISETKEIYFIPLSNNNMRTKSTFRRVYALICPNLVALLSANPNANLAILLTVSYLKNMTGYAEKVFRVGNGGLVLVDLDYEEFDIISEKYIAKGGTRKSHETNMKTDWDKKVVEILKKRDAKDPVIKMMLHSASVFFKTNGLYEKFSQN